MTDRAIRIRVGAALDANTAAVFRPLIEASKKARAAIDAEMNAAKKSIGGLGPSAKTSASKADQAMAALRREIEGLPNPLDKAGGAARRFGKEAEKDFTLAKARFQELARETERGSAQMERSLARTQKRSSVGAASSRVAMSVARGSLNAGRRIVGDILSGAGVHVDLAASVAQNVDLEKRAVDLSNAGYMADDPRNSRRVEKGALVSQVRDVANYAAFDPTDAMEGLQAFVGKTGDLATGRDILKDMAQLSKASGTNLKDMIDAAGDVSNQLEGVENKGEVISQVMRVVAGQGKLGAVEIRDMAKQMAKVAAAASQFSGDRAENIALMGAFAQEARQRGGAASATMAATSVASMINTLKTPARVANFKGYGVDVYDKSGAMNNPKEILIQALQKTGTDVTGFKSMYANVQGARAVEGFAGIYRSTLASTKGTDQERMAAATAAVRAEFERLQSVAMSQAEVEESFNRSMDTTESKVQIFNNLMAETGARMGEELMPALTALAPVALDVAHGLADLMHWVAKITGHEEEGNKANVNAELASMNTVARMKAAEKGTYGQTGNLLTGTANLLPPGLLEQGTEQQHALESALAAKHAQIAADRENLNFNAKLGLNWTEADVQKLASKEGGDNQMAQNYLRHEGEESALRQHLEDIKRANEAVTQALLTGTMKVMVVNQPKLTADMSGRAPAESPIDSE